MEKKRKAEDKLARRAQKKTEGPPQEGSPEMIPPDTPVEHVRKGPVRPCRCWSGLRG